MNELNKLITEAYTTNILNVKLDESNGNFPPGFEFGDEVSDLSDMELTPSAEKVLNDADVESIEEDERQDQLQKHGQDFDLDSIGDAKTKEDDKYLGVDDIQFSSMKKGSSKYVELVKHIRRTNRSLSKSEAEDKLNNDIKAAKRRVADNKTDDKTKTPAERLSRLVHNSTFLDIIDDSGRTLDEESFKKIINVKPKALIARNDKIKKSGGDSMAFYELTMPAYQGLFYNNNKDKFQIVRTCPNAGECKMYCYATKGGYIQYKNTNLKQMRMLNYLMNDWQGFKSKILRELKTEIKSNNSKETVLRWHDSGDFFSEAYLDIALEIAKATPDVIHYAYTKNLNLLRKKMRGDELPDNFVFNFSEGGTLDSKLRSDDKKSIVLPKEVFAPFYTKPTQNKKGKYDIEGLKNAIVKHYATRTDGKPIIIDHPLLTYKEMMELPQDHEGKYSVIVTPEDGDDSAKNTGAVNTILLMH